MFLNTRIWGFAFLRAWVYVMFVGLGASSLTLTETPLPAAAYQWSTLALCVTLFLGALAYKKMGAALFDARVRWLATILTTLGTLLGFVFTALKGPLWLVALFGGVATGVGSGLLSLGYGEIYRNRPPSEVDVEIPNLPAQFDNYKIAQISDFHVGTYGNDTSYVADVVEQVNALNPDLVVFTGDIVNSKTEELEPHVSPLSRLTAPDGVFSILGNHDYGDYSEWASPQAKQANRDRMIQLQKAMGWQLLNNETSIVYRGSDSIAVIGVENIGDPPFHVYGSLPKAYKNLNDSVTKILLSHNPAHWVDSISGHKDVNIPLTLSGHTHAMQMEILGWSPAEYRYRTWGGLYADENREHQLYVNIGVGTVGIPSRIGATPEIKNKLTD